jgi:acyl transferase domain-containing protein
LIVVLVRRHGVCRCKTLDVAADGYARAEATSAVLLTAFTAHPTDDGPAAAESAAAAGAAPMCFLRGSAVGQDGRSSALTAPNGPAQQAVIRMALAEALLQPTHVASLQARSDSA